MLWIALIAVVDMLLLFGVTTVGRRVGVQNGERAHMQRDLKGGRQNFDVRISFEVLQFLRCKFCTHTHTHIYIYIYVYTHIFKYICVYAHTYTQAHVYTHRGQWAHASVSLLGGSAGIAMHCSS